MSNAECRMQMLYVKILCHAGTRHVDMDLGKEEEITITTSS